MSLFKAVFVGIDGVFNSTEFFKSQENSKIKDTREWPGKTLDPIKIKKFNKIAKMPKVVVVISSSWRKHESKEEIEELLRKNGAEFRILDVTPVLNTTKGEEISKWLDENPFIDKFAIIDDDDDMGELLPFLVRTTNQKGLEDSQIEKACALLQ